MVSLILPDIDEIEILIINLLKNPERLINTIGELNKVGLSDHIVRIEACDAINAKHNYLEYTTDFVYSNIEKKLIGTTVIPTWGALACSISHYKCWEYILNNKKGLSLIMEDDIEITDKNAFNQILSYAKHIIQLNSTSGNLIGYRNTYSQSLPIIILFNSESNQISHIPYDNNLCKLHGKFVNTHCYLINYSCAKFLYEKSRPFIFQTDIHIGNILSRNCNLIYGYLFKEGYIKQNKKFKSDVQYHFINLYEIFQLGIFSKNVSIIIYSYLPKKDHIIDNYTHSNMYYDIYDDNIHTCKATLDIG